MNEMEKNQEKEGVQINFKEYEVFSQQRSGAAFLTSLALPSIIVILLGGVLELIKNQDLYQISSIMLVQLGMFLTSLIYLKFNIKKAIKPLRFNKPLKKYDIWLMIPLSISVILVLSILGVIFIWFLSIFGYKQQELPIPNFTEFNGIFVLAVFVIAVMPAFTEEILMRGLVLRSFKQSSMWKGILFSAALFSLMHGNAEQTAYQFAIGIIMALVTVKTGSIWPAIVLHFLNNFIALASSLINETVFGIIAVILYLPALVFLVLYLVFIIMRKNEDVIELTENEKLFQQGKRAEAMYNVLQREQKVSGIVFYSIAIVIMVATWTLVVSMGFL